MTWIYLLSGGMIVAMLGLFLRKSALQLQYRRIEAGENPGSLKDFWDFDYQDQRAWQERGQAFLMFPMLYALPLEEEDERLLAIKREVKRTHILIYLLITLFLALSIFLQP